ncbi:hypothetical protein F5Y15DRAFT_420902 [Xylariaceae sp. FL0016]|nr:hypothetical protein F5Y15DRAFT_420902 [Xylariaceae sp. FL0016]
MVGTTKYSEEQINFILDRTIRPINRGDTIPVYLQTAQDFKDEFGITEFGLNQVRYVTERYGSDPAYGNRWANLVRPVVPMFEAPPASDAKSPVQDQDDSFDIPEHATMRVRRAAQRGSQGKLTLCTHCNGTGVTAAHRAAATTPASEQAPGPRRRDEEEPPQPMGGLLAYPSYASPMHSRSQAVKDADISSFGHHRDHRSSNPREPTARTTSALRHQLSSSSMYTTMSPSSAAPISYVRGGDSNNSSLHERQTLQGRRGTPSQGTGASSGITDHTATTHQPFGGADHVAGSAFTRKSASPVQYLPYPGRANDYRAEAVRQQIPLPSLPELDSDAVQRSQSPSAARKRQRSQTAGQPKTPAENLAQAIAGSPEDWQTGSTSVLAGRTLRSPFTIAGPNQPLATNGRQVYAHDSTDMYEPLSKRVKNHPTPKPESPDATDM